MANKLVRYILDGGQVPQFIEDGGYFPNGFDLVGLSVSDESQIPESVYFVSRAELMSRALVCHKDAEGAFLPKPASGGQLFTEEDVTASVEAWLAARGLQDLA